MDKLSVIIPTKNRTEYLIKCVESILSPHQCGVLPYEIIIVDQTMYSDAKEKLMRLIKDKEVNLLYINDTEISGITEARNRGVAECKGDIVLFLDDDVILLDKVISEIVKIFNEDTEKEIAGIGGVALNQKPKVLGSLFANLFFNGPFRGERDIINFYWRLNKRKKMMPTKKLNGYCCCFRRHILKEFKFDEALKGYSFGEDTIFSYLVSQKYNLFLTPAIKLYHKIHPQAPPVRDKSKSSYEGLILWGFYFFKKYVDKTILNIFFYFLLNMRFLIKFFNPLTISGTLRGFLKLARIYFKGDTIEDEINKYFN